MATTENYEILVLGSGEAGKFLAWTMATEGHRTALIERKALGGSCPNVACLPSKNIIYSARVASLATRGAEFGVETDSLRINMANVQRRKRNMVEQLHQMHVERQQASGAKLIMGEGRLVDHANIEVVLNDGGRRRISAERVFLALGSRAAIPNIPGLADERPMTHVEALDLDRLPRHLIVIGGGYVGLELAQAMRRFGSHVTMIEAGPQLLKMLIGKSSSEIIGFCAFGFEASELMAAVQTAMIGRLPYTMLRDAIFTHPTVAEGLITLLEHVQDPPRHSENN